MKVAADKLRKWLSGKTNSGQHQYSGRQPAGKAGSAERLLSARLLRTKLPGMLCVSGAVILLLLAFSGEDSGAGGEWVPLNDALQAKLDGVEDAGLWARSEGKPESKESASALDKSSSQTAAAASVDDGPNGNDSGGAVVSGDPSGSVSSNAGKLDINRATAAELETLKGIGPSKAAAIVRDRELNGFFLSVDDLLRVKGIGDKLLAGLKESVVANR